MSDKKIPDQIEIERFTNSASGSSSGLSFAVSEDINKMEEDKFNSPLLKALHSLQGSSEQNAPRLAFTTNPTPSDNYLGLFKSKTRLLPDTLIKQMRVTDHLVAAILRARGSMLSLFGHLRKDRFDVGVEVSIKPAIYKVLTPEQLNKVKERIKKFEDLLLNCGHYDGLENQDRLSLSDYLSIQATNGLSFGRFGDEIIYNRSVEPDADGKYPFNRFRPVDIGTIYKTVRKGEYVGNTIREIAMGMLESISGEKMKIDIQRLKEDHFAWMQVIDGTPKQAFTHDEMLVYNIFPSTDIEHNGYPVSPLDTVISSVTTHISIDSYIKLYFQNGRASRGMLVIRSDEVDEAVLNGLKLQFNASINSVSNSFRTPLFGIGKEDDIEWIATNDRAGDGDYQYTYDQMARNILSAFSVSPDEMPGYGHLSKGTNSQTLSESNNEFKLTAARDTGLRPLILKFQQYFNQRLFPLMDKGLSEICEIRFVGIDAQSKEQESTRLAQDMAIGMNYDEVLHEIDKDPVGEAFGGKVPFNERFQLIADKYLNTGDFKSRFLGDISASVDPMLRYKRDAFWLQWIQLLIQVQHPSVLAYLAPRSPELVMEILKMEIQDSLEDEQNG